MSFAAGFFTGHEQDVMTLLMKVFGSVLGGFLGSADHHARDGVDDLHAVRAGVLSCRRSSAQNHGPASFRRAAKSAARAAMAEGSASPIRNRPADSGWNDMHARRVREPARRALADQQAVKRSSSILPVEIRTLFDPSRRQISLSGVAVE